MLKYLWLFCGLTISCNSNLNPCDPNVTPPSCLIHSIYSKTVSDSFQLFIAVPDNYTTDSTKKFPVVYLLDANFYFDPLAAVFKKYAEVDLIPQVILVGIGYKDIKAMDSLRNRDYTYPAALPEYEMNISGGANAFLKFLTTECIPYIDHNFHTDPSKRILAGHSLGGYFSCYSLLQYLQNNNHNFYGYIAASPSLHYNNYYLLNQLKNIAKLKSSQRQVKAYLAFGGLEDGEDVDEANLIPMKELCKKLSSEFNRLKSESLAFKCDTFSNLGHMDTPLPGFIKGLQWILNEQKK
jgi:predicted alpha/beta superfamily hydrolase